MNVHGPFLIFFLIISEYYNSCFASEFDEDETLRSFSYEPIDAEIVNYFNEESLVSDNWETALETPKKRRRCENFEKRACRKRVYDKSIEARSGRKFKLMKELSTLFEAQRGDQETFVLRNYDIINWPSEVEMRKTIWSILDINMIRERMNDFIFLPRDQHIKNMIESRVTDISADLIIRRKETFESLKEVFLKQHPSEPCLNLNDYEIKNWPERVPIMKELWTTPACDRILNSMNCFVFVLMKKKMTRGQDGLIILDSIQNIQLDDTLSRNASHDMLLERFISETNQNKAKCIDWSLLDRSAIHEKYDQVPLNCFTTLWIKVYKNHEIIDNIHFKYKSKNI